MRTSHTQNGPARSQRGSSMLKVISTILGVGNFFVGLVFFAAGCSFLGDGDIGLSMMVNFIAIGNMTSGALLVVLPNLLEKQNAQPKEVPTREIISREVIAGPRDTNQTPDQPTVTPVPVPVPAPLPKGPAVAPADEVANLVSRTHDLFATLKDLVRHEEDGLPTNRRHLASMLRAAGVMDWEDAPTCEAGRLTRTSHYWIRQSVDGLSDEEYDRLISTEAALSVNQDLLDFSADQTVEQADPQVPRRVMQALSSQDIKPYDCGPALEAAYAGAGSSASQGEWFVRSRTASIAESAITPFRVVHDHCCNVSQQTLVLDLQIPRPRCMAIFAADPQRQVALARSYALRLAVLLARHIISHANLDGRQLINTVYVNCHLRASQDVLLALRLDQDLLARITQLLDDPTTLEGNGFPSDESIRAQFDENGWFVPVEPFMTLDSQVVSPRERFAYPELVEKPVSDQLRAITGARTVSDLGINENAGRIAAWDQLSAQPWSSTEEIVSRLKQLLFDSEDITVSEACNRTIEALLAGTVDASDQTQINRLFIGGTALEQAVRVADGALDEAEGPDNPQKAVQTLTEALAPIESLGVYLDDTDTVYRYFGSVSERIRFNLDIDDHRRAVRLVPDAYYNALSALSVAYDELGEYDKALQYADEMARIAPASVHAVLRKVRVAEHQSRIYEAADLIKQALRFATAPNDAAICHYRLAFMEWKLGREDLAVACYLRALTWNSEMRQQAEEELEDLLASNDSLRRFSYDEVCSMLAKEGIPLGCDESDKRRMLATSVLTTDEGIFWIARSLTGILFAMSEDDVLMGVYRSFFPAK